MNTPTGRQAEFVECSSCHRTFNSTLATCPFCLSQAPQVIHKAPAAAGSGADPSTDDSDAARTRVAEARAWQNRLTRVESYKPAIGLGTFLQVLLGLATLMYAFAVWNGIAYRDALTGFEAGRVSFAEAIAIEDRWNLGGVFELIMYVVVGVVWISWMWRLYRNVESLGRHREHSIHWCIWGWVIPIGSLWIPRMVTGDIWRKSAPTSHADPEAVVPQIYNVWWALFLVAVFVSRAIGFDDPATTEAWLGRISAYIWLDGIGIILAVVSVLMVRDLTNRQSQAHQNLQADLRSTMPT